MKVDVYAHILPSKYKDAVYKHLPSSGFFMSDAVEATPTYWDLDRRLRLCDSYPDVTQVLSINIPPLELIADPRVSADLARMGNDELAEIIARYPHQFAAGVAVLPMNNIDAALKETDRAINDLGFKGILVYSNINGKPLDRPEFMPLYEKMAHYDLPIWIHPWRDDTMPDYSTETKSEYKICSALGWPYETAAAMIRLMASGVLEKYPNIKFITHHCGGLVPFLAGRIAYRYETMKKRENPESLRSLSKPPIDYYRMFYADTAVHAHTPALICGYAFFGGEHLLLGADAPFGPEQRLRETIKSIEEMDIPAGDKQKIFGENARRLLHLSERRPE